MQATGGARAERGGPWISRSAAPPVACMDRLGGQVKRVMGRVVPGSRIIPNRFDVIVIGAGSGGYAAATCADHDDVKSIRNDSAPRDHAPHNPLYLTAEAIHAGNRRRSRGTRRTVDLAFVGAARSKPLAFIAAVGRPAVAAVGIAGLTVGFFLWYEFALRGPHGALFLDLAWALALVGGVAGVYGGWIAYSRYFARRARIDETTALQYDAISWSALVLLWGVLLAPSGTPQSSTS